MQVDNSQMNWQKLGNGIELHKMDHKRRIAGRTYMSDRRMDRRSTVGSVDKPDKRNAAALQCFDRKMSLRSMLLVCWCSTWLLDRLFDWQLRPLYQELGVWDELVSWEIVARPTIHYEQMLG